MPAIRHNGSERVQMWVGFSRPVYNNVFCHFLSKCKHLAGHGGVLMVKVVPVLMVEVAPAHPSSQTVLRPLPLARYPRYPRGGRAPNPNISGLTGDPLAVYIELTGSLRGVVAACATLTSLATATAGRPPDSIDCRLGRSVATEAAREWLTDARVQAHFFSRDRWPACQTLGSIPSSTSAFIQIANMLEVVPGMAVQLRRDLSHRLHFPEVVTHRIMGYLSGNGWEIMSASRILRETLYVIHVHARMFNDLALPGTFRGTLPLAFELQRRNPRHPNCRSEVVHAPSLDDWAAFVAAHGPWRDRHPLVIG